MKSGFITPAKVVFTLSVLILSIVAGCSGDKISPEVKAKELLMIVPHGFGVNYYLLQDVFDQYGWHVTCAGLTDSVQICGPFATPRGGMAMKVDTLLTDLTGLESYDAIVLLSSTQFSADDPYADIMGSEHAMNLLTSAAANDIPIFTTCAGVRVPAALGLLEGKSVTGSQRYQAEFEAAGATYIGKDQAPQIIGNLITSSRGQYNNVPNGIAISTVMENHRPATGVARRSQQDIVYDKVSEFDVKDASWAATFGGASPDGARMVCRADDGGFYLVGYSFSHGTNDADIMVIKTDPSGDMMWSRLYGGASTEYANACVAVNGGLLIAGYTTSPCAQLTDKQVCLLRIDDSGNQLWSKTYGGSGTDMATSLCVAENGYIICGFTESESAGETDIYLLKTDTEGNLLWTKTFGGEFTDMGNAVCVTDDGGIVIGATTNSFGGGNSDFYLIKTDAEGNRLWAKAHHPTGEHGHGFDWGSGMCEASDGGLFLVGYSDCDDLMNAFIIKTDADGNQLWVKSFGDDFYDYGNAVCATGDGGAIVCGATKKQFNNNDLMVTKLAADGSIVWRKAIGGSNSEWAAGICLTDDSSCVVVGHTNSCGAGSFDAIAMKLPL